MKKNLRILMQKITGHSFLSVYFTDPVCLITVSLKFLILFSDTNKLSRSDFGLSQEFNFCDSDED